MIALAGCLLAATVGTAQVSGALPVRRIDVDCSVDGALQAALARPQGRRGAEFLLHGVCREILVLTADGVTLRGATPESGIAAPAGGSGFSPLVEVVDARVILRDMVIQGGYIGVLGRGWETDVLLEDVEVVANQAGVIASRGGKVRIRDSLVRDGVFGVEAQFSAEVNLVNVEVTGHTTGITVFEHSRGALTDVTVADNDFSGLQVAQRSDMNVIRGEFRENGQIHIASSDRSAVRLVQDVVVGSETDGTLFALSANRHSSITSFATPVLHGDVSGLDSGSLRLGNVVIEGALLLLQFSDAYVSSGDVTGGISCSSGSDAVCQGATTPIASGCLSSTCLPAPGATVAPLLRRPQPPTFNVRPFPTRR